MPKIFPPSVKAPNILIPVERRDTYGRSNPVAAAIRDNNGISFFICTGNFGLVNFRGAVGNVVRNERQLRRANQAEETGKIFWHDISNQFLNGRRNWHSAGISFWNELVGIRAVYGRHIRRAAGIGSADSIFP